MIVIFFIEHLSIFLDNDVRFWNYSFQKAMKAYGVADVDVFQTVDLWECKDFSQVVNSIFSLGREVSELYFILSS